MSNLVEIHDETIAGVKKKALTLEFLTSFITVEEVIKKRIFQEVTEYNNLDTTEFHGLVQPTKAEKMLNDKKPKQKKIIDWEIQFKTAINSFKNNGFIIIVNEKQADSLDELIELKLDTKISFLKLVPLVGG